jgi:hypothetical protein
MTAPRYLSTLLFLVLATMPTERFGLIATAAAETTKEMLAAQVRTQGVTCDDPRRATRDARRSRPDYEVWVLTCKNATYRVSRYPDMAAKIKRLR